MIAIYNEFTINQSMYSAIANGHDIFTFVTYHVISLYIPRHEIVSINI